MRKAVLPEGCEGSVSGDGVLEVLRVPVPEEGGKERRREGGSESGRERK